MTDAAEKKGIRVPDILWNAGVAIFALFAIGVFLHGFAAGGIFFMIYVLPPLLLVCAILRVAQACCRTGDPPGARARRLGRDLIVLLLGFAVAWALTFACLAVQRHLFGPYAY